MFTHGLLYGGGAIMERDLGLYVTQIVVIKIVWDTSDILFTIH